MFPLPDCLHSVLFDKFFAKLRFDSSLISFKCVSEHFLWNKVEDKIDLSNSISIYFLSCKTKKFDKKSFITYLFILLSNQSYVSAKLIGRITNQYVFSTLLFWIYSSLTLDIQILGASFFHFKKIKLILSHIVPLLLSNVKNCYNEKL